MEDFIRQSIVINASVEKLWAVLTESVYTRQYMYGCDLESDFGIGSPILWRGHQDKVLYVKGEILDIAAPYKLVYSVFDPNSSYEDTPENYLQVSYTLAIEANGTRLEISQGDYSKVVDGEKRYQDSIAQGGWQSVLEGVKNIAEK